MGKVVSKIFIFVLISLCAGCAAKGNKFSPVEAIPEGKSLIYIYRPSGFIGGGVHYDVYVGQDKVCNLVQGGYCQFFSGIGEHEVWGKTESKGTVAVDAKAGKTAYVKAGVGMGFFVGRPTLIVVDDSLGSKEITDCNQSIE